MMTRTGVAGARVVIRSYPMREGPGKPPGRRWEWSVDGQRTHAGFVTLADAIADAQRHYGPDVAITRHTDPEPQQ